MLYAAATMVFLQLFETTQIFPALQHIVSIWNLCASFMVLNYQTSNLLFGYFQVCVRVCVCVGNGGVSSITTEAL